MAVKDEFRLHLYYLSKLIIKYPKILVYGPIGEGKSTIFDTLKKKFPEVNFYNSGQNPVDAPFVYSFFSPDQQYLPDFDIIYCMQYSTEYKEGRTGYKFPKGEWRPIADYVKKVEESKRNNNNLSGKTFKALDKLRVAIK